MIRHLIILLLPIQLFGFLNLNLGKKFIIKDYEVKKIIKYSLTNKEQNIVNQINGFFGNIGPNISPTKPSNMYELLTGNGNIQSIFFNKGEITFVNHLVRTEKLLYEEKNGIIPNHNIVKFLFTILSKIKLLPNILGLANTALININNKLYALYERDKPYLLDINFDNQEINTIYKLDNLSFDHFSAHSKSTNIIETIDYDLTSNTVSYYQLNNTFSLINQKKIKTEYLPIIHDFWVTPCKIIIIDSPLTFNINNLLNNPLPISLDSGQKTIINILNKDTMEINKYYTNNSFFIFHYADYKETDTEINIYASLYDKIDFTDLNILAKFRKININKITNEVKIESNIILEKLSLDFPIKFEDKILFRNMIKNEFVICKDLKIIKKIFLENLILCGEPVITFINKIPHLITFAFNEGNEVESYILIINLYTYEIIKIQLDTKLHYGFHSIFIPNY